MLSRGRHRRVASAASHDFGFGCPLVMYARRGAAQRICSCRISLNLQLDFEPKQLKQPKQPKRPNSRIPASSSKAIECGVFLFSIWLTGTRTRTGAAIELGDGKISIVYITKNTKWNIISEYRLNFFE